MLIWKVKVSLISDCVKSTLPFPVVLLHFRVTGRMNFDPSLRSLTPVRSCMLHITSPC